MWHKLPIKIIVGLILLEACSWLGYVYPTIMPWFFLGSMVVVAIVSIIDLRYGVWMVLAELVIGSFGYSLSITIGSFAVSLRLGLFLVVVLATLWQMIRQRQVVLWRSPYWLWFVLIISWCGVGVALGWWHDNSLKNIFLDVNGFLFLGLIFPFTQALRSKADVQQAWLVLLTAAGYLALKTVLLLFVFSHAATFQYYLPDIYRWTRDFRLGEITAYKNNFYRIFYQSHIYFIFALGYATLQWIKQGRWLWLGAAGIFATSIILSYSRTFWLATLCTWLIAWGIIYYFNRKQLGQLVWRSLAIIGAIALVYVGIFGLVNLPLGGQTGPGLSATAVLTERSSNPTGEAAGSSRLALLGPLWKTITQRPLLGSGFGTTVTYFSKDSRILANNPTGEYTTFAFEWGYLDLWIKLGVVGLLIWLIFLVKIIQHGLQLLNRPFAPDDQVILLASVSGMIAVSCIHMLTPYLNHPLGLGWIIFIIATWLVYEPTTR